MRAVVVVAGTVLSFYQLGAVWYYDALISPALFKFASVDVAMTPLLRSLWLFPLFGWEPWQLSLHSMNFLTAPYGETEILPNDGLLLMD